MILYTNRSVAQVKDTIPSIHSLKEDIYLHPVDALSPYTLRKGEVIYGQPFTTIPFPGWAFVGITNHITAQLDFTPWTFGPFTELKRPIPSFNFRFKLVDQRGVVPTIGLETQYIYFRDTLKRFSTDRLTAWENGSYFHLKPVIGYKLGSRVGINLSAGIEYIGGLILSKEKMINAAAVSFLDLWDVNYSIGLDYRPSHWISYHLGFSYGSTFTYLENTPHKHQLNYGFRLAPFYKSKKGFWRNLRIEVVAINAYFKDIDRWESFSLPVYPGYLYWQWQIKKKK